MVKVVCPDHLGPGEQVLVHASGHVEGAPQRISLTELREAMDDEPTDEPPSYEQRPPFRLPARVEESLDVYLTWDGHLGKQSGELAMSDVGRTVYRAASQTAHQSSTSSYPLRLLTSPRLPTTGVHTFNFIVNDLGAQGVFSIGVIPMDSFQRMCDYTKGTRQCQFLLDAGGLPDPCCSIGYDCDEVAINWHLGFGLPGDGVSNIGIPRASSLEFSKAVCPNLRVGDEISLTWTAGCTYSSPLVEFRLNGRPVKYSHQVLPAGCYRIAAGFAPGVSMTIFDALDLQESKAQLSKLATTIEQLEVYKEAALCAICLDRAKSCVLIPCGHQFCGKCADRVDACPICRSTVSQRVRTY